MCVCAFSSESASKDRILQPPLGFHPARARLLTRLVCVRLHEHVQFLAHGSKLLLQPAEKSWDFTQELWSSEARQMYANGAVGNQVIINNYQQLSTTIKNYQELSNNLACAFCSYANQVVLKV